MKQKPERLRPEHLMPYVIPTSDGHLPLSVNSMNVLSSRACSINFPFAHCQPSNSRLALQGPISLSNFATISRKCYATISEKKIAPLMFIYVHIVLMWLSFRVEHSTIVPLLSISEEPSEVE